MLGRDDSAASPSSPGRGTGLLGSLQQLLASFTEILHTRLDILATEMEEEVVRFKQLLLYGLVALFFLGLGVVFASLYIVVIYWETHRLTVLAGFAVVYLCIGVIAARVVHRLLNNRPRLLSATMAELRKDRDRLVGGS
jgi:uncharacterized membrane protein YqjE